MLFLSIVVGQEEEPHTCMYHRPLNMNNSKREMSYIRGFAFTLVQGPMIHMRFFLATDYISLHECIALPMGNYVDGNDNIMF